MISQSDSHDHSIVELEWVCATLRKLEELLDRNMPAGDDAYQAKITLHNCMELVDHGIEILKERFAGQKNS